MITRLVKMTFRPSEVETFLDLFDQVKHKIRQSEGCTFLQLMQDQNNPEIIFTYSRWRSNASLERYRHSALFKKTWASTKALFGDRPEAWSTDIVDIQP